MRIYTPFGELIPGMAYLVRRLLENTSNDSFLRQSFTEQVSIEDLLMKPTDAAARPAFAPHRRASAGRVCDTFTNEPPTDFSRAEARRGDGAGGERGRRTNSARTIRSSSTVGRSKRWERSSRSTRRTNRRSSASFPRPLRKRRRSRSTRPAAPSNSGRERNPTTGPNTSNWRPPTMRNQRFELAAWEVHECGKPWIEADADVAEAIDFCMYYADQVRTSDVAAAAATCRARRTLTPIAPAASPR